MFYLIPTNVQILFFYLENSYSTFKVIQIWPFMERCSWCFYLESTVNPSVYTLSSTFSLITNVFTSAFFSSYLELLENTSQKTQNAFLLHVRKALYSTSISSLNISYIAGIVYPQIANNTKLPCNYMREVWFLGHLFRWRSWASSSRSIIWNLREHSLEIWRSRPEAYIPWLMFSSDATSRLSQIQFSNILLDKKERINFGVES